MQKLGYLKGYPKQIRPSLSCLLSVQDKQADIRWKELIRCLASKMPELSKSSDVDIENLIHARILPTLRKLKLATGKHERTRLTYRGWYLSRLGDDLIKFKTALAAIIIEIDNREWFLIRSAEKARSYSGESIPVYALALELARDGIDPCQSFKGLPDDIRLELQKLGVETEGSRSRLRELLFYYDYVDIFRSSNGRVTLLDSTLQRASRARSKMLRKEVSQDEFLSVLLEEYEDSVKRLHSPFVPIIPNLREPVCRRLKMDDGDFNKLLLRMVPTAGEYSILLSPHAGSMPVDETIVLRNNRYYYLSIHRQNNNEEASL